eukprot:9160647-Alexandrium_andersonii.AAC.1
MDPTGSVELFQLVGPSVARINADFSAVFRGFDGNLHEFVLTRTCLGHTCPWDALERVGRM